MKHLTNREPKTKGYDICLIIMQQILIYIKKQEEEQWRNLYL